MSNVVKTFLGGAAAMALSATGAHAQVELSIGHVLSNESSYQVASERFKELVEARTDGEVVIEVYGQGSLGGELNLIQGTRTGTVDLAIISQASLENTVAEHKILSLPYLFDSYEQANALLQGEVGQELLDILPEYGMRGLGWGAIYERSLAGMVPITEVDDIDGIKVRLIQSSGYVNAYEALGAQATPLAYAELFTALQNRVVDAAELAPDQTVADRFSEIIEHYTFSRVHQLPSLMLMAPSSAARLSDEQMAIIEASAMEALRDGIEYHDRMTAQAVETMREQGIQIYEPDLEPFIAKARDSWDGILADVPDGEALLEMIQQAQ